MTRPLLAGLVAWALAAALAPAQDAPPRDRRSTELFVNYYEDSESWPVRALALLALGSHWHPVGTPALCDALGGKDERMRPFALETLRRTRVDVLRAVASRDLVEELLDLCKSKHPLVRERALEVVQKIADDDSLEDRRAAEAWWRKAKRDGWEPAEWPAVEDRDEDEVDTVAEPLLDRALDLREAGLDMVIVIDSTGSMQRVINDAVKALDDVVDVLGSLAPRFRVGLVHYRDFGDMSDGARLLTPLSKGGVLVRKELAKLRAGGGGDTPERVEKGLEIAFDARTGWNPDANKLLLVVGDAPPHENTETAILRMVTDAYQNPTLRRGRGPVTGKKREIRPFVTSTISAHQMADRPFKEIAEAGGGTFAKLGPRGRGQVESGPASVEIAKHVLASSFGSQWRDRIGDFVSVWFEYREAAERR